MDMSDPAPDQTCGICYEPGHLWCCDVPDQMTDTLSLLAGVRNLG